MYMYTYIYIEYYIIYIIYIYIYIYIKYVYIKHKIYIYIYIYIINYLIIKQSDYILLLGIFIDENLNWKKQINNIKPNLNRCISLINRLKSKFNIESRMDIYYSLFHCHFHHFSVLWLIVLT